MHNPNINSKIDDASDYFDHITLSPEDWPTIVSAAIAGDKTLAKWPSFPPAATLARQRLGHGRGLTPEIALRSAAGELVEIASCCDWGDLEIEWQTPASVGQNGWSPGQLNGFSNRQYADRSDWNAKLEGLDWIPVQANPDEAIGWLKAQEGLTGREILVPTDSVVIGYRENGDPAAMSVADTNGCAAGPTPEAARLSALCELIERDAVGRWWYGRRPCPTLTEQGMPLAEKIEAHLLRRNRLLHLLDITSDLGVPSVAAFGADIDGQYLSVGFGTALRTGDAIQSAITELMQIELKIELARNPEFAMPDINQWIHEVCLEDVPRAPHQTSLNKLTENDDQSGCSEVAQLDNCLDRIRRVGCEVAFINFTRPEIGVPVFKAVSPNLCHWKPRLDR